MFRFLEAVRIGNANQASAQLTPLAKQKTKQFNLDVAPAGSETASFRVGTVRRTPDGTAWVASQWTDLDAQGKPHADEITWKVLEIDGKWLIAGMSTQIAIACVPSSKALVIQMRSPQITGDDQALPGMGVFHATFSVSLHVSGNPVASLCPWSAGPR